MMLRLNLTDEQTQALLESTWNGLNDYREDAELTGNMEAGRKVQLVSSLLKLISLAHERGDEVMLVI